jgi:phosphoadenosine phosphosulfate reductase
MAFAATEDRPVTVDRIPKHSNETLTRKGPLAAGCQAEKPVVPVEPLVRMAEPEELEWIGEQSRRLDGRSPEEILAWAIERYFPRFTMATGLGPEGCVIISMLAKIEPRVYVFNLDTGYQFRETLELRERINEKYGMNIDLQRPDLSVAEYERQHGGPVYAHDPDRCCHDRKIAVLHRVAVHYDAWATGIRRDQSPTRADTPIVKWDKKFGLVKISPLAAWTKKDVWKRIVGEEVPYNPLHDQNYPSIGCQPCTRAVQPGEDERAGRWSGSAKTECGLHTGKD